LVINWQDYKLEFKLNNTSLVQKVAENKQLCTAGADGAFVLQSSVGDDLFAVVAMLLGSYVATIAKGQQNAVALKVCGLISDSNILCDVQYKVATSMDQAKNHVPIAVAVNWKVEVRQHLSSFDGPIAPFVVG
jgi:hypothetical protein